MTATATTTTTTTASYYRLNVSLLPDSLYRSDIPVEKWISDDPDDCKKNKPWMSLSFSPNGFPSGSLGKVVDTLPWDVEIERCIGISLWMIFNVLPFGVPFLLVLWKGIGLIIAKYVLLLVTLYVVVLSSIEYLYFYPRFSKQYPQTITKDNVRSNQYIWTERNTTKYLSTSYVWPSELQTLDKKQPVIYCLIPHALAPFGVVAYPVWSKLWNGILTSWTAAPIIFQLPLISYFMTRVGYIPAKAGPILKTLQQQNQKQEQQRRNVGIILDGIEGMFATHSHTEEVACILKRKGIVKIALKAGVSIVPVYGFGHSDMYTVWVDPFGILKFLSSTLGVSLTPFFGRWGWFLGPPKRNVAVTVCLGKPIPMPQIDDPNQADIDKYHEQLLQGFTNVFDSHKVAYYGESVGSKKKLIFAN
ncbi:diacylglycerol acyltransferase [Nitzschia inconspicua]|uniref:Acyltransferase n=1 Tax=Nitzschia inconspicua TaxID=303405 RepID=A0A9K3LP14_9STRA|nr:diacylglycerol acyltransferase [Nitzschia inconspicua]KAG7365737.1 diacylglycerol acyltransferase [Nitzschia inconspicua]